MKPIFNTLVGLMLIFLSASLNAQTLNIQFSPAAPGGTVGSVITVDVVAQTFEGIAGAQFPILYDNTKLQFKTIHTLTPDLPNFVYAEPNAMTGLCPGGSAPPCATSIANSAPGKIAMVWFDPSGAGNYLDANTVLFKIEFTVIAAGNSSIYIGASAPPAINVFGENNAPATFTHPTGAPVISGFGLIVPNDTIAPGGTVCVPVTVNAFNSVVGMQFAVNWNSSILTYSHVQNYGVAGFTCNSFNAGTAGRLIVQWEDATAAGVTLANGASLFDVCFTANASAANGTTATVTPNGVGLPPASPISIENTSGANLWTASSSYPGTMLISNGATEEEITGFIADTVNVSLVGNPASVPIKVKNFKNLNHFQFVLTYDPAVLALGASPISPGPSLPNGSNNTNLTLDAAVTGTPGKAFISWRNTSAVSGVTLPDGSVACTVNFTTSAAAPGSTSPITIGSMTTPALPFQVQEKPNTFVNNSRVPTCPHKAAATAGWVKLSSVSAVPSVTLTTKTDVNCFGSNVGAININVTGGLVTNYTYVWSGPGITAANQTMQNPTNLSPGTYQVTVTAGTASSSLPAAVVIAGPTAPISVPTSGAGALVLQNVKCFGGSDGAITINPQGGTSPYTYAWAGGANTNARTGLGAGLYTVTITDAKGCTFVPTPYSITAPTQPIAVTTSNIKNVRCLNESNGSVNTTVTGNQGVVTYAWSNSSNLANPNNLPAGTYNLTVTDANGCSSVLAQPVVITNPPSQLSVATPVVTNPACAGQNNGQIQINVSGGWLNPTYAIQWSNPQPGTGGMSPVNVAPGNYTATITDGNGCAQVRAASVTAPPAITVTNSTPTNVTCHNQANGSIAISLSGAYSSVNWVDGAGAAAGSGTTISGLNGGTYMATVTYGSGCTITHGPVQITNPPAISVSNVNITEDDDISGGAIDLTVSGGTGTLTYSWAGPNNFTGNSSDLTGLVDGTYTVTIKDANNCQSINNYVVPNACQVCAATASVTENACEDDGCLMVTVPQGAQSPFVLSWNGGTQPVVYPVGTYELELCGLAAGTYVVTVTDANNQFIALPPLTITQRPLPVPASMLENPSGANSNGSIALSSASPNVSYQWISGNVPAILQYSPVLTNLDSGMYVVRVTSTLPNGCTKEYKYQLTRQYPALSACSNPGLVAPPCVSSNNGSVELFPQGGDNTFTYHWSNGGSTKKLNNLAAGVYTCTVTSGDGQTAVCGPYTLNNISLLTISNVNELSDYNGYQVAGTTVCNGVANAVITGASGTVSYLWSNGVTTANNSTLCGGAYSVTATDAAGCTSSWAGDLTSPAAITAVYNAAVTYNGYEVSCNSVCDGAARVNITGGVLPYIVKWSTGKNEVITNPVVFAFEDGLCAGEQSVEITDANGAKWEYSFTLTEPDPMVLTFTDVEPSSIAECDGEIIPTAEGAVGDVVFSWRSQYRTGTGLRADGLCAEETLLFTAIDDNGCRQTGEHSVPIPKEGCFQVVPAVTPNDDGSNDYFKITCIETVPNSIEIYDRWNQLVAKFTNYANTWDGRRNGVAVPEGVYFVVATFTNYQGREQVIKGYFDILH